VPLEKCKDKCACGGRLFRWTSPDDTAPAPDGKITEASFVCQRCGLVSTTASVTK
jgi:hypothetical protein